MSAASAPERPVLDIGKVLMEAYRLYGRIFYFSLIIFGVAYGLGVLLLTVVIGLDTAPPPAPEGSPVPPDGEASGQQAPPRILIITGVAGILFWLLSPLYHAIFARAAVTSKLGLGLMPGAAVKASLACVLPIVLLSAVAGLAMNIGLGLFLVPGLYVMAALYVLVPAIVFEQKGFAGLGRSLELTRGYRWAIVSVIVVMAGIWLAAFLTAGLLGNVLVTVATIVSGLSGTDVSGLAYSPFYQAFLLLIDVGRNVVIYPLPLAASVAIYLRLREIKECFTDADLKNLALKGQG